MPEHASREDRDRGLRHIAEIRSLHSLKRAIRPEEPLIPEPKAKHDSASCRYCAGRDCLLCEAAGTALSACEHGPGERHGSTPTAPPPPPPPPRAPYTPTPEDMRRGVRRDDGPEPLSVTPAEESVIDEPALASPPPKG